MLRAAISADGTIQYVDYTVNSTTSTSASITTVFQDDGYNTLNIDTHTLGGIFFNDNTQPDFAFQRILGQYNLTDPNAAPGDSSGTSPGPPPNALTES